MIRKLVVVVDDDGVAAAASFGNRDVFDWLRVCARTALLDTLSQSFGPRDTTHFAVAIRSTGVRTHFAPNSTSHVVVALNEASSIQQQQHQHQSSSSSQLLSDAMRMLWRSRVVADECAIVCLSSDVHSASMRDVLESMAAAERNVKFTLLALAGAADRPGEKYKVTSRANLRVYSLPNWSDLEPVSRKAAAALAVGASAAAAAAAAAKQHVTAGTAAALSNSSGHGSVAASERGDDVRVDVHFSLQLGHQRVRARLLPIGPCDEATARQLAAIVARQSVFSVVGFCVESDLLGGPVSAFPLLFSACSGDSPSLSATQSDASLMLRGLGMALADEASCAVLQVSSSRDARASADARAPEHITHAVLQPPATRGGWPTLVFARGRLVNPDLSTTWSSLVSTVSAPIQTPDDPTVTLATTTTATTAAEGDHDGDSAPKRKRKRPLSATKQAAMAKKVADERAATSLYAGLPMRNVSDRLTPTRVIAELSTALSPGKVDETAFSNATATLETMSDALDWPLLRDVVVRAAKMRSNMGAGSGASGSTPKRRVRLRVRSVDRETTTIIFIPARVTRHLVSDAELVERRLKRRRERRRELVARRRAEAAESAADDAGVAVGRSGGGGGGGGDESVSDGDESSIEADMDEIEEEEEEEEDDDDNAGTDELSDAE